MWDAIKHWFGQKPEVVPDRVPDAGDIRDAEERRRLAQGHRWSQHAHDDTIWYLQGSADGSALLSVGHTGLVRIWEAQTGQKKAELQLTQAPRAFALSPDAAVVLLSTDFGQPLIVWDVTQNLCTTLPVPCKGLATQIVFTTATQGLILFRRAQSDEEDSEWEFDYVVVANFDLQQGRSEIVFETASSLGDEAALLAPDGRLIAWTVDKTRQANSIQAAVLPDGRLQEPFSVPDVRLGASVHLREFSPDGKCLLIYAQDDTGFDHRNEVGDNFSQYVFWDMDGKRKRLALGYESLRNVITYACALDPSVYVSVTEKLAFTRFDDNQTVLELRAPGDKGRIAQSLIFAPEGGWCAYATDGGNIHVFDLR